MTVIVYRDGVLAADSACFQGDIIVGFDQQKVFRRNDGTLYACAGRLSDAERFYSWMRAGAFETDKPSGFEDFGGVAISPDAIITRYDRTLYPYIVHNPYTSEGCNEDFVSGLLVAGVSAEDAVRICIERTPWADGEVRSLKLNP